MTVVEINESIQRKPRVYIVNLTFLLFFLHQVLFTLHILTKCRPRSERPTQKVRRLRAPVRFLSFRIQF